VIVATVPVDPWMLSHEKDREIENAIENAIVIERGLATATMSVEVHDADNAMTTESKFCHCMYVSMCLFTISSCLIAFISVSVFYIMLVFVKLPIAAMWSHEQRCFTENT